MSQGVAALIRLASCFKWVDTELMKSLERHIELYFNQTNWWYSRHLSSLILSQKLCWWYVLCRRALEESENTRQDRAANRTEDMDVAGMCTWLSRNVGHSIAADHITTQIVSLSEREFDLRPSWDVIGAVAHLEWEVPNDPSISLLTLISVLTHTTFVSLHN